MRRGLLCASERGTRKARSWLRREPNEKARHVPPPLSAGHSATKRATSAVPLTAPNLTRRGSGRPEQQLRALIPTVPHRSTGLGRRVGALGWHATREAPLLAQLKLLILSCDKAWVLRVKHMIMKFWTMGIYAGCLLRADEVGHTDARWKRELTRHEHTER